MGWKDAECRKMSHLRFTAVWMKQDGGKRWPDMPTSLSRLSNENLCATSVWDGGTVLRICNSGLLKHVADQITK